MEIWLVIIFALMGAAVGSFLNVCIDRLPAGRSIAYPPSHCDACQRRLGPRDLVPLFSYLWLRGRCRYCRAAIPRRSPLVEAGSGLLFVLIYLRYGLSAESAVIALYCCIFIIIMVVDWEHKLILNKVTYPAAAAAVLILAVDSFLPGLGLLRHLRADFLPQTPLFSGLIGGATGFVFFLIPMLIYRKGMGEGDVKLGGLIGLATGLPMVLVALFIGVFLGGVVATLLLLLKIKGRKDVIPYGTFLAVGPIVTLLWGGQIWHWYLSLA